MHQATKGDLVLSLQLEFAQFANAPLEETYTCPIIGHIYT